MKMVFKNSLSDGYSEKGPGAEEKVRANQGLKENPESTAWETWSRYG